MMSYMGKAKDPTVLTSIITDRVMRTRKQSGVRRILKVCKERGACAQWIRVHKTLSQIIVYLMKRKKCHGMVLIFNLDP